MPKQVIVIGGGAAGFFAAIHARRIDPTLEVLLLEAAPKALGKVKISGGGRCNVTTSCFEVSQLVQHYPRGQRELIGVFKRFGPQDTVKWFEAQGVRLKTEADGRMFPVTDNSQTIVDCLLQTARSSGIQILTKTPVKTVSKPGDQFVIETEARTYFADAVLLATGSSPKAYQWVQAMGHQVISPVPSLFTFNIQDKCLAGLAGISFPHVVAKLVLPGEKPVVQEGPMLITHWGLSGPVVLRLSAWGARVLHQHHYQGELVVDFVPAMTQETLRNLLLSSKQSAKQIGNLCPVDLPKRFWQQLLASEAMESEMLWQAVPQKSLNRLSEALKRRVFAIKGKGVFKEEFVTAGGVPLKEIDMKTMQSRQIPGLYLAGELIDVDGVTGGFNFQNAWSTGWIAGEAMAQGLM